jgi:NitT/TauT family transport system permease protein
LTVHATVARQTASNYLFISAAAQSSARLAVSAMFGGSSSIASVAHARPPSEPETGTHKNAVGDTARSEWETLAGFFLAVAIGVPFGIAITDSPLLRGTIDRLLVVAQSIPKVSIAPLILIWLGYGMLPKIIFAFLVSFFPVVIVTAAGLEAVEPDLLDLARSLRASTWQSFALIRLPTVLPLIFGGLKVAITLAIFGAVIGEFVGANSGLRYVLVGSTANFNVPLSYACLLVLSVLGIVLLAAVEGLE